MTQRCGSCKETKPVEDFSPSYRGRPGTWCRSCFAAHARGERHQVSHATVECSACGGTYAPRSVKPAASFCSRKCKEAARRATQRAVLEAAKAETPRKCEACDSPIPPHRRMDARYCNEVCAAKGRAAGGRQSAARRKHLLKKYGLDEESLAALLKSQGGRCAICRTDDPSKSRHGAFHVDHDHLTGATRGLLCGRCNLALGHMQDDPDRLRAAATYIEQRRP